MSHRRIVVFDEMSRRRNGFRPNVVHPSKDTHGYFKWEQYSLKIHKEYPGIFRLRTNVPKKYTGVSFDISTGNSIP